MKIKAKKWREMTINEKLTALVLASNLSAKSKNRKSVARLTV